MRKKDKAACFVDEEDRDLIDIDNCSEVYYIKSPQGKESFFANANFRIRQQWTDDQLKKEYANWWEYSYDRHFSTHDWLAYIPLMIIKGNPQLNGLWNQLEPDFWTKVIGTNPNTGKHITRTELLLYATAGPDYIDLINYNGYYCPFEKLTHKIIFEGKDIFNALTSIDEETQTRYLNNAVNCSKYLEARALDNFKQGLIKRKEGNYSNAIDLFNLGAFYLGLIVHYLGDCACFTHSITKEVRVLSDTFMMANLHFRNMVSERTDLRKGYGKAALNESYEKDNLFYFFKIDLDRFNQYTTLDTYRAAYNIAFRTCYDSDNISNIGKYNSTYLIENYRRIMRRSWNDFNTNWQLVNIYHPAYNYLMAIQRTLEYAIWNILWFFNNIIKQTIKYAKGNYVPRFKDFLGVIMEKQEVSIVSYEVLKAAFQHYYIKVKEYFEKRGILGRVFYLHICEYISGHLSNKGDVIDLDWYRNERDLGGFSREVNGKVYAYCQDKVLKEGQYFIPDDEPLLKS